MKSFLLLSVFCIANLIANAQTPTWAEDVAPILYANCTKCHHTNGAGHFPLITFSDAYNYGFSIATEVSNKTMPPWPPDENYKHFARERVLTTAEITTLNDWVNGGRPQGDITKAPAQPTYSTGSQLGTVDLTVKIPNYTVTSLNDDYRNFPITTTVPAGKYITAVEVIPGNTHAVHHVLIFQDSTNMPAQLDANQAGPGYSNAGGTGSLASRLIAGWTPGASPYYTPVGLGFRLAANTNIVVQVHYPAGSQGQLDSTRINFKLANAPLRDITVWPIVNHLQNINQQINIPAGQTRTYTESQAMGNGNYTFLSAFPHMHLIGRTIKSWANTTVPGDTIRFVDVPDWDFHWQDTYVFPNAVKVPSNSTIKAIATYDNTTNNPDNPNNPPQNVVAGEATTDEMMMVFFGYLPYQNGDENIIIDRRILAQGATTFCSGQQVTIEAIEGTGYTYQWYRNGTLINGANSFSFSATQAGNYHAVISLGPNNANSDTIAVTVSSPPTANVTYTGSPTVCPNSSLTLNAGTGNGYTYQWMNNGNPIANATSSSYNAAAAGVYSVQVYNGCYAKSSNVSVTTASAPSNTITPSGATTFCQGGSVILNAASGLTYLWSNSATSQSITVSQNGNYKVTVTNANNCTAVSGTVNVVVNSLPSATITPSGNTTICQGNSVALSVPSALSYMWSTGQTTQTVSASQQTIYSVTVTDANGCSASSSVSITVNNVPSASITPSGATSFCNGGSVTLQSGNAVSYLWSNGATTSSVIANASGNYTVTITDANGCTNAASQTVTEFPVPDNSVTTDKPTTICAGDSVTLSAVAGTNYLWNTGAVTQHITTLQSGSFVVTVTDNNNCTAVSQQITVTVNSNAVAAVQVAGNTIFCEGQWVVFSAQPGDSYLWNNGETTQSITVNTTGSFTVTVTNTGSCVAISEVIQTTENLNPVVSLSGNAAVVCSNSVITLQDGTPSGGAFSGTGVNGNSFDASTAGVGLHTITYTYTDANGCSGSATENMEVEICSGLETVFESSIRVYPNPNNGLFTIDLQHVSAGNAEIKLFDAAGKLVYSSITQNRLHQVVLSDNLAKGIYYLLVKTENELVRKKLMVE